MSVYSTNFPPQTYSSSFYINALTEGEKTSLMAETDDENDEEKVPQEKTSPILDCFIAAMYHHIYTIFLSCLATCSSQITKSHLGPTNLVTWKSDQLLERWCFHETTGKIRTFSSLIEYQSNRHSFDPQHHTYDGNVVQFSMNTINRLSTNDFVSFGSNSIFKIDLHHQGIQFIEVGAFKELYCLDTLDLSYNKLANITEGSFKGLWNLKILNLSHNMLTDIPDSGMAFLSLIHLKILDLSFNHINKLNTLSFMMLYNLETLNLGYNEIKTIDEKVFDCLTELKQLYLNGNYIEDPTAHKWKSLGNLIKLDLSNNFITSFDTSNNYSFSNLKWLNLSGNGLQSLNIDGLTNNFKKLKGIDLSDNSWLCNDLMNIKHHLIDSRISLPQEISCDEIKIVTAAGEIRTSAATTITDRPLSSNVTQVNEKLVEKNSELMKSHKELEDTVNGLKILVIFLMVVIAVGITIEIGGLMGVTGRCFNWFGVRTNRGYLDSSEVETLGLISR